MRTNIKAILAMATAALLATDAGAVTAWRGTIEVRQPDGTTLRCRKAGDEKFHYLETEEGWLVAETPSGMQFARPDCDGLIRPLGLMAVNHPNAAGLDISSLYSTEANASQLRSMGQRAREESQATAISADTRRRGPGRFASSFPATGEARVLVILVDYQDTKFNLPDPHAYYDGMLNQEGFSDYEATGCAKEYFRIQSNDMFKPRFDVFGPVTLPNNMAYYGANNDRGSDMHAHEMVTDAAKLLDDEINFADYDMDDDGYVDNIFIIYAGQGEATFGKADTVWPHSSDLVASFTFEVLDKKILNHYACCNEWLDNRPDGVGTFIHEFSHVIGLPDLYCTSGERITVTPGSWSVLDYGPYNNGGHTPPNYSAYERYAMGWAEPHLLAEPENLVLRELAASNDVAIIPTQAGENEFFLLENRRKTGWDAYLPGEGMMVWHVDYLPSVFETNNVNNAVNHQRVDIIEANGKADSSRRDTQALYPFPGPTGNSSLGFATTPQLADWAGRETGVELTDIREGADGRILARVNGGVETLAVPTGLGFNKENHGFRLTWQPVEGAEAYEVEVTACYDGESGEQSVDMGSGGKMTLPEGWSSSTTKVYSTSGNYGKAAPSFKMENDGDWLEGPEAEADIRLLSFWVKGQQTAGSSLRILGKRNGEWETVAEHEVENAVGRTVEIEMPEGIRAVRIEYAMSKGRAALDDVLVVYGFADHLLEGYAPKRIDATSAICQVETGETAADRYLCRVRAISGDDLSHWSETLEVKGGDSAVKALGLGKTLTVAGRTVSATPNDLLRAHDLTGRKVAEGKGSITLPEAGLYIISCNGQPIKTLIK